MITKPELLYLDLMKKVLSFTLWKEPGTPIEELQLNYPLYKRILFRGLSRTFRSFGAEIVKRPQLKEQQRKDGMIWPRYADTR